MGIFLSFIFFLDKKERKNQEKTKLSARKMASPRPPFFQARAHLDPRKPQYPVSKKNLTSWIFLSTLQSQFFMKYIS